MDILGATQNLTISPSFNALSEMSFDVPYKFNNNKLVKYYNKLIKNRLIKVEGFKEHSWFIIKNVVENNDGARLYKHVECVSYEYVLNRQNINLIDNVYKLYDPISPANTLLYKVIQLIPAWSIGYVSSELWNKYRRFDESEISLYSFLMSKAENSYDCIFLFDTENKIINIYTPKEAVKKTDIYLSLDNLIKNVSVETTDDEVITCMSVYGDSNLDIRNVNPMGTTNIYNFNYVKNPELMSKGLIDGLTLWESIFNSQQKIYGDYLVSLKSLNSELVKLKGQLVDLESAWKTIENVRVARIDQGLNISDITNQINENERMQKIKKEEIQRKQKEIDSVNVNLKSINQSVQFKTILSENLLKELDNFINTGSYQNENFSVTKNMSYSEIQNMAMQLYERANVVLKKMSQPNYTFNMDVIAFPFLKKYSTFINQIRLGSTVNAEIQKGFWIEPVLLKMDIPYDSPTSFKMYFSNNVRLTTAEWTLEELQNQNNSTSNKVGSDAGIWGEPVKSGVIDEVSKYMSNALNLANQSIQSSNTQDFLINEFGLMARKKNPDDSFSKEQFRLVNNLMAYTDDAWQSVKSAFGKIKSPYGNEYLYGLIAPAIVGNLIAGNQLLITNENNYFRVDGSGATLYNAILKLLKKDNLSQILLDPDNGIKIQTKSGNNWIDSFYTNLQGKIVANDIITERGTIGGFEILSDRLRTLKTVSVWHNFDRMIDLRNNGTGRLGLLAWDLNNAWFNGNIWAKNLQDKIVNDYVENDTLSHDKVDGNFDNLVANTIRAKKIFADYGEFKTLKANVAEINEAYINKLQAKKIISDEINTRNLVSKDGNFSGKLTANITYCNAIEGTIYADGLIWKGEELIKLIQIQDKDGTWHEVLANY